MTRARRWAPTRAGESRVVTRVGRGAGGAPARRRARRLLALGAALSGGAVCPRAAIGQGQPVAGPVVVGQRAALDKFTLEHLSAAIELYAQQRHDERESSGQPDRDGDETTLRSDLELSGRGFVGHRDLLDLNGVFTIGLERIETDGNIDPDRQDDSTRILFDLNALILGKSDAPLTLYARRDESTLDREFSSSIDSTNSEYGAILRVNLKNMPTMIQVFHREVDQDDPLEISNFSVSQDTLIVRSDFKLDEDQQILFEYTLDSIDEEQGVNFANDFVRNDLLVQHQVNFGAGKGSYLRSTARYFDETGQFAFRRLRLDEQLWLKHSDTFETIHNFAYEDQQRQGEDQQFLRGTTTARHELFDSLVTAATLGASDLRIDEDFDSQEVFGDINLRYTKRVPYGRLNASGGVGFNQQDNSERGSPASVANQPLVFPDSAPAVINRSNIEPGSIVVRDAAGIRVFVEGVDYTAQVFPDRAELRRVVGGDISAGELTLVDFTIGPEPASTIDSTTASVALRYTFERGPLAGLSPYLEYQQIDRSVDSAAPELLFVDDVRDLTYGVEYRRGPFTILGEQQERDSDLSPFDLTRLEGRYEQRLGYRSRLSFTYTYEEFEFPLEDNTTTLNRAVLRYDGRPRSDLDLNLFLEYRDEDSDSFGNSTGFDQSIEAIWRKGRTTVRVAVRNSFLDSDSEDRTSQEFTLSLRREF